jgi:DNA-binding response OmpR family regulator
MHVLVVDDEHLITDTICAILNANGFSAVGVYGGDEALLAIAELRPEIVLSDVLMPRMSGVELAIKLRDQFPDMKIVLLSGQASTSGMIQRAEADGYYFTLIPKPIHPDDLIARLKKLG